MIRIKNIALIVEADSYLPLAKKIGNLLSENDWEVSLIILKRSGITLISERQLRRFGMLKFSLIYIDYEYVSQNAQWACKFDAVFLGLTGAAARDQIKLLRRGLSEKYCPVIVCGFPGVSYYKQTYGQWCKIKADILLFNDRRTLRNYRQFCKVFGITCHNDFLLGYPSLNAMAPQPDQQKDLVYIDQSILPKSYKDRRNLFKKIIEYGEKNKFRKISFLARNQIGEHNLHPNEVECHISKIVSELLDDECLNIEVEISYASPEEALRHCSVCLGITSTVLLEAMNAGIPTTPLRAKGIGGAFNGTRLFQLSPMAMHIEDLVHGASPTLPTSSWKHENIFYPTKSVEEYFAFKLEKIISLTDTKSRSRPSVVRLPNWVMKFICRLFDCYFHRSIRTKL
ncbi:DUF6716 putative glycosyltransferase [Pseudovibrio ascidiaceicola]|uniref:DUF6716 putative glycosyltransferase n=1 Tax=Pseudovibrio ascidiaceicola TaxID=285279 RepID=UPI000D69922D|nr:DUF6716 putative glycosyltransferase [Pseudovibrio ascidiaceicola]